MAKDYAPRIRLSDDEYDIIMKRRADNRDRRILVIPDLHEPFTLDEYLDFCLEIYNKYNCNNVVFIGDILDNHFSSYHETDPDGFGAGQELDMAKDKIKVWHDTFPDARVCLGNHDLLFMRKAMTAGLSKQWVREIGEVLDTPTWEYAEEFDIDGVTYVHGTARKARNRAKSELTSVVQGHYHSESYIEHFVGKTYSIFAMQLGCGIDRKAYAMNYGKHFPKPHINVGVVLENGTLPILEYMKL
jgi:hypothetical protein